MKRKKNLKETTNRRVDHILRTIDPDPYSEECLICPMRDHCDRYKHNKCRPHRSRERNWKSQRRSQWKTK